jgi:hypothetical protein
MLLYAVVIAMSGATIDRRLVWGAAPYLAGFVATSLVPAWGYEWLGAATTGAMGLTAMMWRGEAKQL